MDKKCSVCLQILDVSKFNKSSSSKDGYQCWCRDCQHKKYEEYRKNNPDIIKNKWKRYYNKHKEKMIARTRKYEKDNSDKIVELRKKWNRNSMMKRYGITEEDYIKLRESQEQKCAMCGKPFGDNVVHIDHSHKNGHIRGILCIPCNMGLGIIEKDNFLNNALVYLRKTEK